MCAIRIAASSLLRNGGNPSRFLFVAMEQSVPRKTPLAHEDFTIFRKIHKSEVGHHRNGGADSPFDDEAVQDVSKVDSLGYGSASHIQRQPSMPAVPSILSIPYARRPESPLVDCQ